MGKQGYSELQGNKQIRDAIRSIALKGIVNRTTGSVNGMNRISGFVAKINLDGELAGTIDVQEYNQFGEDAGEDKVGYHEGVFLSAIQDNTNGMVIIPKLYSEVVITADPVSDVEYVVMYSHVDLIQLDSHETITIGVREREEFDASDDSDEAIDIDELEDTGTLSKTTYEKDSVLTEVHKEKDSHISQQFIDGENYIVSVDDDETNLSMNKDEVVITREQAEYSQTKDEISTKVGSMGVFVEKNKVSLGSKSGTDNAVLGQELAKVLSEFLQFMGQMLTTTMMGPQPPINLASFISLKAKVDAYAAGQSGFLTQKVFVQK